MFEEWEIETLQIALEEARENKASSLNWKDLKNVEKKLDAYIMQNFIMEENK